MLSSFLDFVIDVFSGIISIFRYADLGGFTLENVLVAILILSLVIRVVIVNFGD